MQRATSGLERSVVKWVSQVSVSVGATLIATMIYGALPRASVPAAPAPAMTSGGKFAARAEPASAVAYDGLDTMPLPHVATPAVRTPVVPAAFLGVPAVVGAEAVDAAPGALGQIRQAVWDEAVSSLGPDRGARKAGKSASRSEAKRSAAAADRPQLISLAAVAGPAEAAKADDGILPKVVSAARDAWSLTTSAGSSLLSRLIP